MIRSAIKLANHKSALKRAKQNETRRLRNKMTKSVMKNAVKNVVAAKETGDDNTEELLRKAQSTIAKAAKKGVLHKNTAARKISRLTRAVNAATTA